MQLEDSLQHLHHFNIQEGQADIQTAQEVLHNTRESLKVVAGQMGLEKYHKSSHSGE